MFGLSRKPKEEPAPAKPYKVDLEAAKAERKEADEEARAEAVKARYKAASEHGIEIPNQQQPAPPSDIGVHLLASSTRARPSLPPSDLIRPVAPDVADLIDVAQATEAEALMAYDYWRACLPGGGELAAAFAAHRAWAAGYLDSDQPRPTPSDDGPLYRFVTATQHEALVAAFNSECAADAAARAVRESVASSGIAAAFDKESNRLRDEMIRLLEQAYDDRDVDLHRAALKLAAPWREPAALHRWATTPTQSFDSGYRTRATGPAELELLVWEVESVLGMNPSPEIPLHALELPGAPRSKMFPNERPPAPFQVLGQKEGWGPQGPPPRRSR